LSVGEAYGAVDLLRAGDPRRSGVLAGHGRLNGNERRHCQQPAEPCTHATHLHYVLPCLLAFLEGVRDSFVSRPREKCFNCFSGGRVREIFTFAGSRV
jgi:hypothetical protein